MKLCQAREVQRDLLVSGDPLAIPYDIDITVPALVDSGIEPPSPQQLHKNRLKQRFNAAAGQIAELVSRDRPPATIGQGLYERSKLAPLGQELCEPWSYGAIKLGYKFWTQLPPKHPDYTNPERNRYGEFVVGIFALWLDSKTPDVVNNGRVFATERLDLNIFNGQIDLLRTLITGQIDLIAASAEQGDGHWMPARTL